ncbi:flagellar basal body protein FliL [Meridianimarinicoccus roseus]|jgi:flagellar FliL protein|uniref:Flagellar protein FliL n=1 Tax=Meridianimarinicoccus roseus TaxID=2072018 RepID=A0A2V2L9T8_9RHOB|nr:flagellar basal body-associated FliL family protein [Meridianimarinicoccus roseus]PWR02190.1 flagellar basal body protein FliL [Meridianimarinicoccus roseus]
MAEQQEEEVKKSKKPLLFGALAAVVLGIGGYLVASGTLIPGLLGGSHAPSAETHADPTPAGQAISYVPIEPLMISMTRTTPVRQLRLEAELEVVPGYERHVESQMPKVLDVMNTYLRAIDLADIEDPAVLLRTRLQLLRRVQVTVGEGVVEGLLITKFLIS